MFQEDEIIGNLTKSYQRLASRYRSRSDSRVSCFTNSSHRLGSRSRSLSDLRVGCLTKSAQRSRSRSRSQSESRSRSSSPPLTKEEMEERCKFEQNLEECEEVKELLGGLSLTEMEKDPTKRSTLYWIAGIVHANQWKKQAANNDSNAQYILGELHEQIGDDENALRYYELAATNTTLPVAAAQYSVARLCMNENNIYPNILKDEKKALSFYRLAIENGHYDALDGLKYHLDYGKGKIIKKDPNESRQLTYMWHKDTPIS